MILSAPGRPHLTYCTNIHPGETWPETFNALETYLPAVKERVCPDRPFGVGLRLSAAAAEGLSEPGALQNFRSWLDGNGLYVFTINGFPYGDFHSGRIKENVYLPDWRSDERLVYTERLARILAALLPADVEYGSISTVPGAFRSAARLESDSISIARQLRRCVETLKQIEQETGRRIVLALEPEPMCLMETTAETVDFFDRFLFPQASETEDLFRRHIGICIDACHAAVEFEDLESSLSALRGAEIPIAKIQISSGLRIPQPGSWLAVFLKPFMETPYLHQVVEKRGARLARYADLADAVATLGADAAPPDEWRIHFHVPVYRDNMGPLFTTQDHLKALLALLKREAVCPHLEIETYTLGASGGMSGESIVKSIVDELMWVRGELES